MKYPLPTQRSLRCGMQGNWTSLSLLDDIDIVLLFGKACITRFIQMPIKKMFPSSTIIIEEKCEKITATGATIHVLQVLNKEVNPYIEVVEHEINEVYAKNDRSSEDTDEERDNVNNEILIERHESDIASQNKSSSEKKSDNSDDYVGFDKKAGIGDDQVTAVPPLEVGNLETKQYYNTTDVESSQEKASLKEKALLP